MLSLLSFLFILSQWNLLYFMVWVSWLSLTIDTVDMKTFPFELNSYSLPTEHCHTWTCSALDPSNSPKRVYFCLGTSMKSLCHLVSLKYWLCRAFCVVGTHSGSLVFFSVPSAIKKTSSALLWQWDWRLLNRDVWNSSGNWLRLQKLRELTASCWALLGALKSKFLF